MKTIKSILGILGLSVLAMTSSCQDDFDAPSVKVPTSSLTPNTTIAELKAKYWSDDANYIETIKTVAEDNDEHVIIHGRVISSDAAGNIYKNLVIADETAALSMSINANSLYNTYRVGQEIVIDATDMYIGKYSGLQQLGFPDYSESFGWQATFMPLAFFEQHAELNGLPEPSKVEPKVVTSLSEISGSADVIQKWQSQLVRFNNCHFALGGEATFTDAHKENANRDLILEDGSSITVRMSGYCNFWSNTLPAGNGDVVGILGYFNNNWQLLLRSIDDCMNFGHPTLSPGTEGRPYTVDEAIELEMNGTEAKGWVTGYIVGAVAPGVSNVTTDADIQWGKTVDMPNTIVIAPTPEVKTIANCLILPLPQGSALRQYGSLAANPELYQRQIWVNGTLGLQLGSWGVATRNGGPSEFRIDGITVDGGSTVDGDGTKTSPYNVPQVIALGNPGTQAYVEGYIVGWVNGASISEGATFTVPAENQSNVLIAATSDETDYNKCVVVQLVYGTGIREAVNLVQHPENLGKKLVVQGNLEKYFGVAGVKSPTEDYTLDGQGTTPDTPVTPPAGGGEGTATSPYTISQVLTLGNPGTSSYVKGYIVGWVDGASISEGAKFTVPATNQSNVLLAETPGETDINKCVPLQLVYGTGIRNAVNLVDNPGNLGKELVVQGNLEKYFGVAGVKSPTEDYTLDGVPANGGGTTPDTPSVDGGTESNPFTVAQAISLNNPGTKAYVTGYIVAWVNGQSYQSGITFTTPATVASNIVIADSPNETDPNKCMPVQLVAQTDIRKALNLVDNPGNLGKKVTIQGELTKYFNIPGLKAPSAYTLY